jgi:hypothetical protein
MNPRINGDSIFFANDYRDLIVKQILKVFLYRRGFLPLVAENANCLARNASRKSVEPKGEVTAIVFDDQS